MTKSKMTAIMCELYLFRFISSWFSLVNYTHRISLGISRGDGTLHIGFDQHDNDLRYRISKPGIATHPDRFKWTADLFGLVLVSSLLFLCCISSTDQRDLKYQRTRYLDWNNSTNHNILSMSRTHDSSWFQTLRMPCLERVLIFYWN